MKISQTWKHGWSSPQKSKSNRQELFGNPRNPMGGGRGSSSTSPTIILFLWCLVVSCCKCCKVCTRVCFVLDFLPNPAATFIVMVPQVQQVTQMRQAGLPIPSNYGLSQMTLVCALVTACLRACVLACVRVIPSKGVHSFAHRAWNDFTQMVMERCVDE